MYRRFPGDNNLKCSCAIAVYKNLNPLQSSLNFLRVILELDLRNLRGEGLSIRLVLRKSIKMSTVNPVLLHITITVKRFIL